jgi:pullulanase/glycogen debranching enzyme
LIYELRVKGFTQKHPDLPSEPRGTYVGLAHHFVIRYLKRLGVTAIELMPGQQFGHDMYLLERGLHNYWGYPLLFCASQQLLEHVQSHGRRGSGFQAHGQETP